MSASSPSKDGAGAKNTTPDDDDNLYYKIYAAGVVFVLLSLTFHGCLFYTCHSGVTNFGTSFLGPSGGTFLGRFNETWRCEEACLLPKSGVACHSFSFFTADGQCYGATTPRWDPVPYPGGGVVTGVSSWFAKSMAPLARFGKAYGVRPGLLVSTAQEIRKDVKQWALFAAVSSKLSELDAKTQADLWMLTYALLLLWPLAHLLLVDRHNFHSTLKSDKATPVKSKLAQKRAQADKAPAADPFALPDPSKMLGDLGNVFGNAFNFGEDDKNKKK